MGTMTKAANVGTCRHLLPLLEEALARGVSITGIDQGYSETRQVVRVSKGLPLPMQEGKPAVSEPIEYFESADRHYHPVTEAGVVCRLCRQAIAWDKE
jgi:hypothetical protein